MPIMRINGQLVPFIHVPKTGGETIERYLRLASEGGRRPSFLRPPKPDILPCAPQHLHAQPLRFLFQPGVFDYAFAVVRDPVARAISEYRFRAGPQLAKGRRVPDFPRWWARMRRRYAENPYLSDNHIRPQVDFMAPELAARYDVFRFEDGPVQAVERACDALQVRFTDLDVHTQRAPHMAVEVDGATFESLVSFYSDDIAQFGYALEALKERHVTGRGTDR